MSAWVDGNLDKQITMHTRGYDFSVDRQKTLLEKIEYCHRNPIMRGLVDRRRDWPWSSDRHYELGDSSVLRIDWDGVWPIAW